MLSMFRAQISVWLSSSGAHTHSAELTMTLRTLIASAVLLTACSSVRSPGPSERVPAPRFAAHQHLISPAFTKIIDQPELDGAAFLTMLDAAEIERGLV